MVYETDYITSETPSWNIDFNMNNPPYSVSIWDIENWWMEQILVFLEMMT